MVGIEIIKKNDCTCTAAEPCDRKAGPDEPGYCDYCFRLEGPCPADGSAPLSEAPPAATKKPPRVSPRKKAQQ